MSETLKNTEEDLSTFVATAPDLKRGNPRKIEDELYKKGWQEKAVDEFERRLGFGAPAKVATPNVQRKSKTFQMEFDKDKTLFEELLNNPKYKIIMMDKTWTVKGDYRIFTIYEDNLDYKPEEKKNAKES